ncbi:PD40 domain-containing protein [Streptomyces roseirectus]|uniref:PD40 domain-containing protein n=1 Tax=Streptomyces roseirectus TaxID=2768066 RepID=A0A7H0IRI2_9ACTN|nr:amidohydrolase family protein [Streptomyces roseirectus]QNP75398.1 PD40 domain-containing protein [Streptomyces roseirectus]
MNGRAIDISRRGFIGAGAGVAGVALLPAAPAGAAGQRGRTLSYTAGTNAAVTAAPDGRLLIEVQGVLWTLPKDGGTATALTDTALEPTRPTWSPDGTTIAFCAYQGGGFHLWTMAPDGSRLRQLTSGPWDDRGVSWSPDGTRLAFASERGGNDVTGSSYDIWTVEVATGRLTRLTDTPDAEDHDPAWHPDGDRILFVRAEKGLARTIASVPATGGEVSVVRTVDTGTVLAPALSRDGRLAHVWLGPATVGTYNETASLVVDGTVVSGTEDVSPQPPAWTADGALLYFADGRITRRAPAMDTATTVPFTACTPVTRTPRPDKPRDFDSTAEKPVRGVHFPVLAPDGRSVAYCALGALWHQPLGGRPRKLVEARPEHYVQMPAWSRDGRSLVYVHDSDGLAAVHRVDLADGTDTVLASGGRVNPALAPDGSRLACHDITGNLLVVDLADGTETRLAAPLGANGLPGRPSWSPDGRYLALCDRNRLNQRFREGYNVIRIVDTRDGTSRTHLPSPHTSLADRYDSGPVWSPDGRHLAYVSESALWLLPVRPDGTPDGEPRRLTDAAADHPSWSGDSARLLHLSGTKLRLTAANGTGSRTIPVPLTTARSLPPRTDTVRVHAGRLWDGTGDSVRENVDVVIEGNRITAVEPHRAARAGERTLDASRQTVLPGLWDAHTHPYQNIYGGRQTRLNLAYGVTSTASLGGFAYEQARLREATDAGALQGPRLFTTGELIDGSRVAYSMGRAHATRDGVRRSLERARALDYDFVKTYVRAPAATMAQAARTARELGVPAGSHLVTPGRQSGQTLTTHLLATQRQEYSRAVSPTGRSYQDVHEMYRGGDFALIITPFSALALLGVDPELAEDPRVTALMPPWDTATVRNSAATPPTAGQLKGLGIEMGIYRAVVDEGGAVALGTDAPLTPVGLHVHLALRALHRHGGFTPAEALTSATLEPARVFGVADDLGTVEPGKLADLTAVDGDPFTDFDDLVRTAWTMRDGTVHRTADLVGAQPHALHTGQSAHTDWLAVGEILHRDGCCAS